MGTERAEGFFARRPHFVPGTIAAVMLVAALAEWPYAYYRLLRWVTCAAAVFTAYQAWGWKRTWAIWPFALVAILFNPLVPVHLTRQLWQPVDLATASAFLAGAFILAAPIERPTADGNGDRTGD